jgi:hypothetical protein
MKVIIDLIEDIRESIANAEEYELRAGLLKEDPSNPSRLVYAGEAPLNAFELDEEKKQLLFKIDGSGTKIDVGALIPELLILGMDAMMYELRMAVNAQYREVEIIGFGKNEEEKAYILFIKL